MARTKDFVGSTSPELHKELVRICALEKVKLRDKVGEIVDAYLESNREVVSDAGKGTEGLDGEGGREPKGAGGEGKSAPKTVDFLK